MAFQFPYDKVSTINAALALTGDNTVAAADDGSDEWNTCSPAYEIALGYIMESHSWGYATVVTALQPSATAPADTDWDTQYPIPPDCVHLIWAKINDDTADPTGSQQSQLTLYDIMGTPTGPVLVINAQGGPPPPATPQTPARVTIKYVSNQGPLCDAANGTPTLIAALQRFVVAAIYRGLHEDPVEASNQERSARLLLQEARTRYDQQKPKRQFFNSRMQASRRVRRPWPQIGTGNWGGSGIP